MSSQMTRRTILVPQDIAGMAMAMPTASRLRLAASSWESPVRCAAATKSSAPVPAASASNVVPAKGAANAARELRESTQNPIAPIRLDNRTEVRLIGHAVAHGYTAPADFGYELNEQTRRAETERNSTG